MVVFYFFLDFNFLFLIVFFFKIEFSKIFTNVKTSRLPAPSNKDTEIYNLFKQFDRDNSGYLTVGELKQALAKAGYIFSDAEISQFVASIDLNFDGKLSYNGKKIYIYKILNSVSIKDD